MSDLEGPLCYDLHDDEEEISIGGLLETFNEELRKENKKLKKKVKKLKKKIKWLKRSSYANI